MASYMTWKLFGAYFQLSQDYLVCCRRGCDDISMVRSKTKTNVRKKKERDGRDELCWQSQLYRLFRGVLI